MVCRKSWPRGSGSRGKLHGVLFEVRAVGESELRSRAVVIGGGADGGGLEIDVLILEFEDQEEGAFAAGQPSFLGFDGGLGVFHAAVGRLGAGEAGLERVEGVGDLAKHEFFFLFEAQFGLGAVVFGETIVGAFAGEAGGTEKAIPIMSLGAVPSRS